MNWYQLLCVWIIALTFWCCKTVSTSQSSQCFISSSTQSINIGHQQSYCYHASSVLSQQQIISINSTTPIGINASSNTAHTQHQQSSPPVHIQIIKIKKTAAMRFKDLSHKRVFTKIGFIISQLFCILVLLNLCFFIPKMKIPKFLRCLLCTNSGIAKLSDMFYFIIKIIKKK